MNLVILEPLGLDPAVLERKTNEILGDTVTIQVYPDRVEDVPTLIERSKDADIVMLSNSPFTREVMAHCPKLKMVCVAFTGVDHIDLDYCREKSIAVTNASGYATVAVAELVFGLLIALYRRILPCDSRTREQGTKDGLVGFELEGKTFGVLGAGTIGMKVAHIAHAFGCQVLLTGTRPLENIPSGMKQVEQEELLKRADILSLHTPLTPQTQGLIGEKELALMKPSAVLINTARGPVVDSWALAQALKEGRLAGAGLDVFDEEPPIPSDDPLLSAPNTVLTPHVAFATQESMEKRADIVLENVDLWLKGTPQNLV